MFLKSELTYGKERIFRESVITQTEDTILIFENVPLNTNISIKVNIYRGSLDNLIYSGKESFVFNSETPKITLQLFSVENSYDSILLENKLLNGNILDKTSEVFVVPSSSFGQVNMSDDSSWSSYYNGTANIYKGVSISARNVKLNPYAIGQYEVTQELYETVMKENPSYYDGSEGKELSENEIQKYRPVEYISWYKAIAFCNELTKKTMTVEDCVYYSDTEFNTLYVYNKEEADSAVDVFMNPNKKGYRLPTEAEWEFAARGGDVTKEEWRFAFAGSQTQNELANFQVDDNIGLNDFGWYYSNPIVNNKRITHNVGLKKPNSLKLYDMSGNVYEWCYDWFNTNAIKNDSAYSIGDSIFNPLGDVYPDSNPKRVKRGGDCTEASYYCSVSYRKNDSPNNQNQRTGFRLARYL